MTNFDKRDDWYRIHAELMDKLNLPCKFKFSDDTKVGSHVFNDDGTCTILVNPDGDFHVPAHLIMHEAAHCRNTKNQFGPDLDYDLVEDRWCCMGLGGGHCEHWAQTLIEMYREAGIPLPYSTQFPEFAKLAKIEWKFWVKQEESTIIPHIDLEIK